jgi:Domain of unknown function (DUF4252)
MKPSDNNAARRRWRWVKFAGIAGLCVVLADCGILGNRRLDPGYAAFGSPGVEDTKRDFALSLGPLPLSLSRVASRFVLKDEPELSAMLVGLRAVRVYTYEVNGDMTRVAARMEAMRADLVHKGWQQIVAVRDDGELVTALIKMEGPDRIRGMAVLVQDDEDITLVNVIGNIRPENFGAMMAALDIDVPSMSVATRGHGGNAAGHVHGTAALLDSKASDSSRRP